MAGSLILRDDAANQIFSLRNCRPKPLHFWQNSPEFPLGLFGLLGSEFLAQFGYEGGVAGGGQLGEERFDAGDGGGGEPSRGR